MEQQVWSELAVSTRAVSRWWVSGTAPPWRFVPWDEVREHKLPGVHVGTFAANWRILERSLLSCKERVTGKHLVALGKCWNAAVELKGEVDSQPCCVVVNEAAKVTMGTWLEKGVWLHEDLREGVMMGLEEALGLSGKTGKTGAKEP